MTVKIDYEYSSEYGDWSSNVRTHEVPADVNWEEYCENEYPKNDGECGGYHFVRVRDLNGTVLYERGEEVGCPC